MGTRTYRSHAEPNQLGEWSSDDGDDGDDDDGDDGDDGTGAGNDSSTWRGRRRSDTADAGAHTAATFPAGSDTESESDDSSLDTPVRQVHTHLLIFTAHQFVPFGHRELARFLTTACVALCSRTGKHRRGVVGDYSVHIHSRWRTRCGGGTATVGL
jgi:hypothetical protein